MYKFLKNNPLKRQNKESQVIHTLKVWAEKRLRQSAAYLNRKTSLWNKKTKTFFLMTVCLFFMLSIILLFLKRRHFPTSKGMAGPVIIKLTVPPENPKGFPPAIKPDSGSAIKKQKKPP